MVTPSISAVLFNPGDVFEGFTILDAFRTGEIQAFTAKHERGAAVLYCIRKRNPAAEAVSSFNDRARRLQSFTNDMVPAVLGFGYSDDAGCFWLATEDRPGASLEQCFEVSRDLIAPLQSLVLFADLAALLAEADQLGIHHYALTPSSIWLETGANLCRVSDLGVAEVFGVKPRPTYETVAYCAPELLSGEPSTAADIFAAGMILWELVARRAPYLTDRCRRSQYADRTARSRGAPARSRLPRVLRVLGEPGTRRRRRRNRFRAEHTFPRSRSSLL